MDVNIRDWTFTHWWVRPVVKQWFNFYHKSVRYSGIHHVDWQKPIIFAPSHQNAFSDALCLILPTQYSHNRFIYPLIRADAFGNNKAIDWMLTAFHMMPVYRPRDNVNLREQNESVFAHCHEILFKNSNLLIHPEGNCIPKKNVGRFKKGLARIALGAEEQYNFNLDVNIIPVGINYRSITEARQGIHVRFGTPIQVSAYKESYETHPASAITELTRAAREGVKEVTIDISSRYRLTEKLLKLQKSTNPEFAGNSSYTEDEIASEKKLTSAIVETEQESPEKHKLDEAVEQVENILNKYNLSWEESLVENRSNVRLLGKGAGFLLLLPLFLYGWINNIIPWKVIHKVADLMNQKQFKNSARMVSGLLLFPFCYITQAAVFGVYSGSIGWTAVYLLSLPLSAVISLNIWEKWQAWGQQIRLKKMPEADKSKLFKLINDVFQEFKSDFNSMQESVEQN